MPQRLRIGTRQSQLALVQAEMVRAALGKIGADEGVLCPFITTADKRTDCALADIGGKALFTREIDRALLEGEVDCAVHSLKDMETELANGLAILAMLPRADPRDALIGADGFSVAALPKGARVGTSAVRRRAQLLALRPDLEIVPVRGNVQTRLGKLKSQEVDALILAKAGLDRLGQSELIDHVCTPDEMLPAASQGIVAIVARLEDEATCRLLRQIDDASTHIQARAERSVLHELGGDCGTPVAVHASLSGNEIVLEAAFFSPNGDEIIRKQMEGSAQTPEVLGQELAVQLKSAATQNMLATLKRG